MARPGELRKNDVVRHQTSHMTGTVRKVVQLGGVEHALVLWTRTGVEREAPVAILDRIT